MQTYKVTLTVIEPVELIGFFEGEDEKKVTADLLPKIIERWGPDNVKINSVELATEEEYEFAKKAIEANTKENIVH